MNRLYIKFEMKVCNVVSVITYFQYFVSVITYFQYFELNLKIGKACTFIFWYCPAWVGVPAIVLSVSYVLLQRLLLHTCV